MRPRQAPDYREASPEDDGLSDSEHSGAAAPAARQAPGRKRGAPAGDAGARAIRRRRSATLEASDGEGDPIESADEDSGNEGQWQRRAAPAAEVSWDDEEEVVEVAAHKPARPSGRVRRTAAQRQAAVEDSEEQEAAAVLEEEEEEEGSGGRRQRPRRAAAAAKPSYRDPPVGDDEDDEDMEEAAASGEEEPASEVPEEEEESESEEGSDFEEEEEKPQRRQPARRAPARGAKLKSPKHVRRTERSKARINYNVDEMLPDEFEEEESSSEEEEEEESGDNQASRPTRRAAKLAGKAIRQQTGGGGKRRKQPTRAAVAAKRRTVVLDDSDEAEEGESDGEEQGSGSNSRGGSGSEDGASESYMSESGDDMGVDTDRVEKILESRMASDGSGDEFLCKFAGLSYRKARWLPYDVLVADRQQLLRNFQKKKAAGEVDVYGDLVEGVDPRWLEVDRVIGQRTRNGRPVYLVKWRELGYGESTWETERDLKGDEAHIERYERFNTPPDDEEEQQTQLDATQVPDFCNGRQLRDYQHASLVWHVQNWVSHKNCILGDEMGLGKTAQAISVLAYQRQFGATRGPFLVIAPLTTLGHWQREIETWTDMNCVVYAGGAADRALIQKHDLFFPATTTDRRRRHRLVKPNVVLVAYDMVLKDKGLFTDILWETVIIDEAHRMKSTGSSTRAVIASMQIEWLLLLTGTPVQNNMRELFGILNLIDPHGFADEEDFLDRFGDERTGMTPDQVRALQEELRPILLRRMKEDVETLPEKEEVIIWVELSPEQRAYYRAIYENEIGTLLAGASSKNMPNLRNLAMELRKVCCHPYLCNGLEEDIQRRKLEAGQVASEIDQLVAASGKMVLLHKLLPKLKSEGRKVLIFSQFKMMLDVLEDYVRMAGHNCERIDGSTASRDRQAAIDRFSKEGSDGFVFLLSTRAGGQGITLTAADTCIIYDSDWNPQNDLQAMARCHRIGQDKEVTIYRLVSKNTYENNVFEISSRKYGLDEAILGNLGASSESGNGGGNPEEDSKMIAQLLKHGAHCLHEMDTGNEQGGFEAEGIDEILQGRTEKRQIGGRAGNTFSVATFGVAAPSASGEGGADDRTYWTSLLPGAVGEHEKVQAAKRAPVILAPRQRKQIDYKGQLTGRVSVQVSASEDADYVMDANAEQEEEDEEEEEIVFKGKKAKKGGKESGGSGGKRWTQVEVSEFLHTLVRFGEGRAEEVRKNASLEEHSTEECAELEAGVLRALSRACELEAAQKAEQHKQQLRATADPLPEPVAGAGAGAGAPAAAPVAATAAAAADGGSSKEKEGGGVAAADAAGGNEEDEEAKKQRAKKAKDRSIAEGLAPWIEAEMGDVSPSVAHALRSKPFLEWANSQPSKTQHALKLRRTLASWVRRLQQEDEEALLAAGGTATDSRSPGSGARHTLPWLKSKSPHGWHGLGGWHESDTHSLILALHQMGWVARKGRVQTDMLSTMLQDEGFVFHKRVAKKPEVGTVGTPNALRQQQQEEQEEGAQAMDAEAGAQQAQQGQQGGDQPQAGAVAAGAGDVPAAAAAAAGAAGTAPDPMTSPSKAKETGPRLLDSKEWASLLKGLANFINNVLLPALEQPAPTRHVPSKPAAAGASKGMDSCHGSSADLQRAQQAKRQALKLQQPGGLAKKAAANAAAAAAVAAAVAGGADEPEGISQASDGTPPGTKKAGLPKATATGYTNPLTSAGGAGGAGGSKPPSAGRKPQLPLQPSTGPKELKGKKAQQSIMNFLKKPKAAAALAAPVGAASEESPGGRKENEPAGGSRAPTKALSAQQQQPAPDLDSDVVVVE